MTDRLHLSATKEQQILIEEAEDRSMSNRTIIEINHDYAHEIDTQRFEFCNALIEVLRSSSSEEGWNTLARFGVRHIATGHHSEELAEKLRKASGNRHRTE